MQFSNARLLSSDDSGHLNELNLNNSVSSISSKLAPVLGVEQVKAVLPETVCA